MFGRIADLQALGRALERAGRPLEFHPSDSARAVPILEITLDTPRLGSSTVLRLSLASDVRKVLAEARDPQDRTTRFDHLQFFATLGRATNGPARDAIGRTILALNTRLPLIGFGMDPESGEVHFRHMLPFAAGRFDPRLVDRCVGLIEFALQEFGPELQAGLATE